MRPGAINISPLASGVLLALSFPPFNYPVLPFVALIPLFHFLESVKSPFRAFAGAFSCGLVFWGLLIYWITLFTHAGFVLLIIVMSVNFLLFTVVTRRLSRRFGVPLSVGAPFVWTAVDYIHAHGDLAFTWGQLAYSLSYHPLLIQFASVTGPYGVTFWIVSVNAVIYLLLKRVAAGLPARRALAAAVVLLAAPVSFGMLVYIRTGIEENAPTARVAYVQPSIPQDIKWSAGMRDSTFDILGALSLSQSGNRPDLVVWPEAAAPAYLRTDSRYRERVGAIARTLGSHLLTGAPEYDYHENRKDYDSFNSAFLFDPSGDIIEKYDKIRMVPVSERMPFEDRLTFLRDVDVGGSHFVPGDRNVVFEMGERRFGVLICFESIFPELSRKLAGDGAQFLVNITNDAWFERTSAAYQHSAFLVLRAIENRREIVRSANTGVSAFYDRIGRRRHATRLYETAAVTDEIRLYDDRTLYNILGDWPAHLSWISVLSALLLSLIPLRRKQSP